MPSNFITSLLQAGEDIPVLRELLVAGHVLGNPACVIGIAADLFLQLVNQGVSFVDLADVLASAPVNGYGCFA